MPNTAEKQVGETDEALALLVQSDDKAAGEHAFGTLMQRYEPKLSRYGKRFLFDSANIEDAVQDIFIKTYQNIQSFDATRRFSPWIYRIAHNVFVNTLRAASKGPVAVFDFDALLAHQVYEDPAEAEKEMEEMLVLLKAGLDVIAPAYREILILHYLEELSYQEIADVLQVPMGTVGVRLHRARAALKQHISQTQQL